MATKEFVFNRKKLKRISIAIPEELFVGEKIIR
jgi:hypothetical protein